MSYVIIVPAIVASRLRRVLVSDVWSLPQAARHQRPCYEEHRSSAVSASLPLEKGMHDADGLPSRPRGQAMENTSLILVWTVVFGC